MSLGPIPLAPVTSMGPARPASGGETAGERAALLGQEAQAEQGWWEAGTVRVAVRVAVRHRLALSRLLLGKHSDT